jgi:hypothetical protein
VKAAISVDASQAPSDTTQNRIGNAGVLSEARYVAPKASMSHSWEDEEHMRWEGEFAARLRGDGVEVSLISPGFPQRRHTIVRRSVWRSGLSKECENDAEVARLAIEALQRELDAASGPEDARAKATLRHLLEIAAAPRR